MKIVLKKQMLFLTLAVFAGVALILFGYFPIAWQKRVIWQAIRRQSMTETRVQDCEERVEVLERQVTELEPLVQRFEQCVPQTSQFSSLWRQIAELMVRCDLQDQQVRPGSESQYNEFNVVSLDIQGCGTLPKIFDFVRSLEQMDRLVRIEEVNLANSKDQNGQLTFSAKAQVFYRTTANRKTS